MYKNVEHENLSSRRVTVQENNDDQNATGETDFGGVDDSGECFTSNSNARLAIVYIEWRPILDVIDTRKRYVA